MKLQWQNAAIIIGLIGGLISIPKSAIEAWQAIFPRPKLELWKSQPVTLAYESGKHLLTCSFGILLQNSGNEAEVIKVVQAHLDIPDDPLKSVKFSEGLISLKESQNEISNVLSVEQNTSRTLTCEIRAALSEPLDSDQIHALLTQDNTSRELVIELAGESRRYSAKFNFDFSADNSTTLFVNHKPIPFIGSEQ